jgi:UDP-N-acetylmuramoyl-L-alanyl-D-glutamate--2,6-diaminopimelate ligase
MLLFDLLGRAPGARLAAGDWNTPVTGIAYDSRQVAPGHVFFALPGQRHDGHEFVPQAMAAGAAALVLGRELSLPCGAGAQVVAEDTRSALAYASAAWHGRPAERLQVVGVTGTKGKTTTTHLVRAIFEAAGHRTGLVGTVHNIVGGRSEAVRHTTPEAPELQGLFRRMVDAGDSHVVMEVSSHALAMSRVGEVPFGVAALTNLGHDHLDFHHTHEAYAAAKAMLFAALSGTGATAVINGDDPAGQIMRAAVPRGVRIWTYGLGAEATVAGHDVVLTAEGGRFRAITPVGAVDVRLQLPGRFNVYNALCALAIGIVQDVSPEVCAAALGSVAGVPGRFERVDRGQPFGVIVDYAHTPESMVGVLETARELTSGRLILVFGCGGDRDRTRRPTMGRLATELADRILVTSDNPRSEDPERIIDEIVAGMPAPVSGEDGRDWTRLADRAAAIRQAIAEAGPGDVVMVIGKGHETYQIIGDRTLHFDDREVAAAALAERGFERSMG